MKQMQSAVWCPPAFIQTLVMMGLGMMLVMVAGCESKAKLDENVDVVVESLAKRDYDRLMSRAGEDLKSDLSKEKFEAFADVVAEMGAYKERSFRSINIENSVSRGDYKLTFANLEIDFWIVMENDKIQGFGFDEDDFQELYKKAQQRGQP